MGFFKQATEGSTPKSIARLHKLMWTLIYGGLLLLVLGLATRRNDEPIGWAMIVVGAIVAAVGFSLIWVRSRISQQQQ